MNRAAAQSADRHARQLVVKAVAVAVAVDTAAMTLSARCLAQSAPSADVKHEFLSSHGVTALSTVATASAHADPSAVAVVVVVAVATATGSNLQTFSLPLCTSA
tara:strand:- start:114 stop:425 length:312 start_codon:yes stop_codon:yes gene_type:complete